MSEKPAIACLPNTQRLGPSLASRPLSDLVWPLGCPARWMGGKVGDLGRDDHLIVFPKTATHFILRRGTKAQISLILGEPSAITGKHLTLLRQSHRRFWRVLSFNETLLARIPNGIFFPLGTTWVPEWRDISLEKTAMCSLIVSSKRNSQGHKLRHEMVEWVNETSQDVAVMGRGYVPFENKSDGVARYRFTVVIENTREKNYFSEKLVDAVLCDSVPIYWGCPNLDRFVDTSGIIQCKSAEDVKQAIQSLSHEKYEEYLPRLQATKPDLERFCNLEHRAAKAIEHSLVP